MAYLYFHNSIAYMLLSLLATIVRCQTARLLEPPAYTDGLFTNPLNSDTQTLDVGAVVNVTWTTTYEVINLYLIFGTDYKNSFIETLHTTEKFYLWTVDDHGNNSLPFSFHAVNGTGTDYQRAMGGFWSGQFYLRDTSVTTSTTSSSTSYTIIEPTSSTLSSATTTSATSSSASLTASEIMSSSEPRTTSEHVRTSSTISSITTNSASPTSTIVELSSTSAPATDSPSSSSGQNHVVIGVGVGIGVGVAALLIGAFVFWRRHHNRSKQRKADDMSSYLAGSSGDQKSEHSFQMGQRPRPPHLPSYELAEQTKRSPVEVYDRWQEPRELPGSPFRR